ncbi:MAG: hypothetical protein BWK73_19875 [Thiothrix lacustris]|uniref:DUF3368 domain-containing protein n=1 Tax=Thiothrix lacustris TaxID=525917 RepID=A0A1Y1QPB8_9GAMM|nr:MAG: hypothetical protein BWK73_19875 [Thiothrix lacustris]
MAQVVIADAGPLLALAKLDSLHLLEKLFGTVLIPEAVQRECMAKSGEDSQRIQQAIDSQQLQVISSDAVTSVVLPRSLGDGEKEAISLAIQYENSLLIVDDQLARRQAAKLGLTFIGLIRLLAIAEQQGLLDSAEQAVETVSLAGYRVSLKILRQIQSK